MCTVMVQVTIRHLDVVYCHLHVHKTLSLVPRCLNWSLGMRLTRHLDGSPLPFIPSLPFLFLLSISTHPSPTHPSLTHPSPTHPSPTHPSPTHPSPTHPSLTYPSPTHPSPTHPSPTHPSPTHPSPTHPSPTHPSLTYQGSGKLMFYDKELKQAHQLPVSDSVSSPRISICAL